MRPLRALICLGLLALVPLPATALDDWCGFEQEQDKTAYEYGNEIRAKFIFIDFPDSSIFDFDPMEVEEQQAVVEKVKWWFSASTPDSFSDDSGIVFKPGDDFNDGTAEPWRARFPGWKYDHFNSLQPDTIAAYNSQFAAISDWWAQDAAPGLTRLSAEILYKIYTAYADSSASVWPFGNYTGGDKTIDVLFLVFMAQDSPWSAGGSIGIPVDVVTVLSHDGVTDNFFGNIKGSGTRFQGTFQTHNSVDTDRTPWVFKVDNSAYVILHEFSHTLGWPDGPPPLQGMNSGSLGRYYYGYLNVTCQHFIPGRGIPVMSLHNLATKDGDWIDVVDFTGQNLKDQKVYDLRYQEGAEAGKIYRFRQENAVGKWQTFYFGFHAGKGVDAQHADGDTTLMVRSRGLEVQHVLGTGGFTDFVDIESAFGLYHSIAADTLPPITLPPPPESWGEPAPEWGFDNYDLWWVEDDPDTLRKIIDCVPGTWNCWPRDYSLYTGAVYDFFTANKLEAGGDTTWTAPEFSFRTNPSTFWYSGTGPEVGAPYRFNYQNVPNSLCVRIRSQHNDPVSGGPYIMVDFLSAPYDSVLAPDGSLVAEVGDTVQVRWTGDFEDDYSNIEIFFHPTDDDSLYFNVAGYATSDTSFAWIVQESEGTEEGRIRLRFHNPYSSYFADEFSSGEFTVDTSLIMRERLIAPNGGEELVAGIPTDVQWTNHYGSVIRRVDMLMSTDSGETWSALADSIDYDTQDDVNVYSWTPPDSAVSDQVRLKLQFRSTSGIADDASDGDLFVFPLRAKFTDATNTGLPQRPYAGVPASVVPIAVENDTSGVDVLVSVGSGLGNPEGKLFVNGSIFQGDLDFDDESATYLPDNLLEVGFGALVVGDYDGGGEDFFACRPDDETSQLFRYDDDHFESANGAFAEADSVLLSHATCASWIDYDHDGDLDLYVGRADGSSAEPDALFELDEGEFEDVAPDVDLSGGGLDVATSCVAWTDLDGDGMWEIARGSSGSSGVVQLFTQVSADSFAVVQNGIPGEVSAGNVQAVHWADFDRDNDFDLLIMLLGEESYVCENVDGNLVDAVALPTEGAYAREGMPLDFDLDGWTDILVPNDLGNNRPLLLANFRGLGGIFPDFKDMAEYAGIGAGVDQFNVLAADLNRDGDQDLFVGRDAAGAGTLYNNVQPDSTETPASHWVGFRLVSGAEDNDSAIGTTITLATASGDDPLGVQIVDGGSGRGSQSPRQPIFGLGDLDEPVGVAVRWPAGRAMEFTVDESDFDQVVTVVETDSLHIDDSSVANQTVVYPGDLIDWVFTWETDFWSNRELDYVEIQHNSGSTCANLGDGTLNFGDQNVSCSVTYQVDPQTGDVSFKHELRWLSQECYPSCSYKYKVHSSNGTVSDVSPTGTTWKTISHKVCPHSN